MYDLNLDDVQEIFSASVREHLNRLEYHVLEMKQDLQAVHEADLAEFNNKIMYIRRLLGEKQ